MQAFLARLEQAADLREVQSLIEHILAGARAGGKPEEKHRSSSRAPYWAWATARP